jgi:hypothetical protein
VPPGTPSTLQLTDVLLLPVTTATYEDGVPSVRLVAPAMDRVMPPPWVGGAGATSATGRLLKTAGLVALLAVMVTTELCGAELGAM